MLRSFLSAPCLLVCLACATPFPLDTLEEGMTAETVRENFGEPEAIVTTAALREAFDELEVIEIQQGSVESSWTYSHEDQVWFPTVAFSSVFLPPCIVMSALVWIVEEEDSCFRWYVERKPVVLQFADGKLASWIVFPDPRGNFWDQRYDGSGWDSSQHVREMLRQMDNINNR